MEDIVLKTTLGDSSDLYISPIDRQTYDEHVQDDSLGGSRGYFVVRSYRDHYPRIEVLAKVPSLEAAEALFDLVVNSGRSLRVA